jgi:hypothetical protein
MSRIRFVHATLAAALCACWAMPAFAQQDIDKVFGGITAEAGRQYGDLETVNGGIHLEDGAQAEDAETVNGGIKGGDDIHARSLATVNGGIRLGERARITRNVETVNGGIRVGRDGKLGGDVTTVNGAIELERTEVAGGLETVSGDITVGAGSHVHGGIRVEKPEGVSFGFGRNNKPVVVIGPGAVVDGPLVFERDVTLYVHATARTGAITGATAVRFSTQAPPSR